MSAVGANAFTVKLQPLSVVKGRLLDPDGKPLTNQTVVVKLSLDGKRFANLPTEYNSLDMLFSIIPGAWRDFTGRETTTAGGRIPSWRGSFPAATTSTAAAATSNAREA